MGQQTGGGTPKWLVGCGVGCVVIIFLGIAVLVAGYFAAKKGMGAASKALATELSAQYAALKASNKVPAEHIPLFDELVAVPQQENASMFAVTIVSSAVTSILADGQVTEAEAKKAHTVRDFIVANPDCSMLEMAKLFSEHPELSDLQMHMQQTGSGSGVAPQPVGEPSVEEQ